MNWFLVALKKYVVFEGRSRRAEYWYFVLFAVLIQVAAKVVDRMFGSGFGDNRFGPDPKAASLEF